LDANWQSGASANRGFGAGDAAVGRLRRPRLSPRVGDDYELGVY
jgi:hypothetical protein